MTFVEAVILYTEQPEDRYEQFVIMMVVLGIMTVIVGYKLRALDFLDNPQYLLTMIEQNEASIVISDKMLLNDNKDKVVTKIAQKVTDDAKSTNKLIYQLLNKYDK